MWFSYDGAEGHGFQIHETEEEARDAAQQGIEDAAHCSETWPDDIESYCYGKVAGIALRTSMSRDPGTGALLIDYGLKPVQ